MSMEEGSVSAAGDADGDDDGLVAATGVRDFCAAGGEEAARAGGVGGERDRDEDDGVAAGVATGTVASHCRTSGSCRSRIS